MSLCPFAFRLSPFAPPQHPTPLSHTQHANREIQLGRNSRNPLGMFFSPGEAIVSGHGDITVAASNTIPLATHHVSTLAQTPKHLMLPNPLLSLLHLRLAACIVTRHLDSFYATARRSFLPASARPMSTRKRSGSRREPQWPRRGGWNAGVESAVPRHRLLQAGLSTLIRRHSTSEGLYCRCHPHHHASGLRVYGMTVRAGVRAAVVIGVSGVEDPGPRRCCGVRLL